jgi:hypothetical protein
MNAATPMIMAENPDVRLIVSHRFQSGTDPMAKRQAEDATKSPTKAA